MDSAFLSSDWKGLSLRSSANMRYLKGGGFCLTETEGGRMLMVCFAWSAQMSLSLV